MEPQFEATRLIDEERDYEHDVYRVSKRAIKEDEEWERQQKAKLYTKAEMKRIPTEVFDDNWDFQIDIKKKF